MFNIFQRVSRLEKAVQNLQENYTKMAIDLSALTTAVQNEKTVEQSAVTLIQGIEQQLQQISSGTQDTNVQNQINDLVTQMQQSQSNLATAVTANTSAGPSGDSQPQPASVAPQTKQN